MAYERRKTPPKVDGVSLLKAALKEKNPGRLYFFYGEESYLRSYYLETLKKQLLDGPAMDFNFHRFTTENMDLNAVQDAIEALPMMAERSLIQIDDYDPFKLKEDDRETVIRMISDLPDYCCVVFNYETEELKPDKRMKKLHEAITKHGLLVEFRKQDGRELVNWVRRHFIKQKKDIDDKLSQYLIYITGGTMTALASEITKICTYMDGQLVTKADIDAVVEPVMDAVVFDITDAIAAGDYGLALEKLQMLMKMQEEPIPILGAIGAQMRRLRCAKVLAANGKGGDSLMKLCSMADYPARKTMSAAAKVSLEFCNKAVLLCTETDYRMKTSYDRPQRLLEILILELSEEARHG